MIFLKKKQKDLLYNSFTQVVVILFAIVAFFKFVNVYELLNLKAYASVYAMSTLLIIYGIFEAIRIFNAKASNIFIFVAYIFTSLLSFVDVMYYAYNNKLPAVSNLSLLWQLAGVGESVLAINPLKYWWIGLDLIFLIIYAVFIHKKLYSKISKKLNIKILKIVLILSTGGILIFGVLQTYITNFKVNYLKSEMLIYHARDIYNTYFKNSDDIDYEKYLIPKVINKDEKYGIANGKNVIIIQVEALQSFVIDRFYDGQEITPFLNKLKDDSYYFENYYYTVGAGNTSDAEFEVNNSIYASSIASVYTTYYDKNYYGLPFILKDNGYTEASAFHGYDKKFWNREEAYKYLGFDNFYSSEDFSSGDIIGMGVSDKTFLKETASKIKKMQEPFYSFIVTLSSHHPFYIGQENEKIKVNENAKGTLFGDYLNATNYVDSALKSFFDEMKKCGLYDNSIFVIYGDHFAIPNYNEESANLVAEFVGHDFSYMDMFNVPCIIHVPNNENGENIETVASHVDMLPTLLHLLGIENEKSIMMGNDLFTVKDNVVCEQMHVGIGSFISEDVFYYVSNSGLEVYNKAFDRKTGKEILIPNDIIKQSKIAEKTLNDANFIIKNNMIIKNNNIIEKED